MEIDLQIQEQYLCAKTSLLLMVYKDQWDGGHESWLGMKGRQARFSLWHSITLLMAGLHAGLSNTLIFNHSSLSHLA